MIGREVGAGAHHGCRTDREDRRRSARLGEPLAEGQRYEAPLACAAVFGRADQLDAFARERCEVASTNQVRRAPRPEHHDHVAPGPGQRSRELVEGRDPGPTTGQQRGSAHGFDRKAFAQGADDRHVVALFGLGEQRRASPDDPVQELDLEGPVHAMFAVDRHRSRQQRVPPRHARLGASPQHHELPGQRAGPVVNAEPELVAVAVDDVRDHEAVSANRRMRGRHALERGLVRAQSPLPWSSPAPPAAEGAVQVSSRASSPSG